MARYIRSQERQHITYENPDPFHDFSGFATYYHKEANKREKHLYLMFREEYNINVILQDYIICCTYYLNLHCPNPVISTADIQYTIYKFGCI